jgi:hypothetical protein
LIKKSPTIPIKDTNNYNKNNYILATFLEYPKIYENT